VADAYYSSVSLLLHCNGSDGSTTFTDESPNPKSVTALSDAQIDTAQSKWGGASGSLETLGDTLTVATDAAFGFGSGAFTVEAWIRPTDNTNATIFDFRTGLGQHGVFYLSSTSQLTYTHGTVYGNTGTAVSTGAWSHVRWDYDGTTMRAYLDGVEQWSATFATSFASSCPVTIGANYTTTGSKFLGHIDDIRITKGVARGAELPSGEFEHAGDATGQIAEDDGPLQQPTVLGLGPLVECRVSDAGPLGAELFLGLHDFTEALGDVVTRYVMDLVTPGGDVRVPISSWQATQQTDSSCYAQCVIPSCGDWTSDIDAATEFVIYRTSTLSNGDPIEYEMVRSPVELVSYDRGTQRYTATISGYDAALTGSDDAVYDRTLTGLRSVSVSGGLMRTRCEIDWLLRPGNRAYIEDTLITVAYINYYVQGIDTYMDVGER